MNPIDITQHYSGYVSVKHLGYYFKTHDSRFDEISKLLLNFKDGNREAIKLWVKYATKTLGPYIPSWPGGKKTIIVRALGHSELRASGTKSLDVLANVFMEVFGGQCVYKPTWIYKTHEIPSLKGLTRDGRHQALGSVYAHISLKPDDSKLPLNYIILDDVITTGSTLHAIRDAIKNKVPNSRIYAFGLCRTYDDFRNPPNINSDLLDSLHGRNTNSPVPLPPENDEDVDSREAWEDYQQSCQSEGWDPWDSE